MLHVTIPPKTITREVTKVGIICSGDRKLVLHTPKNHAWALQTGPTCAFPDPLSSMNTLSNQPMATIKSDTLNQHSCIKYPFVSARIFWHRS